MSVNGMQTSTGNEGKGGNTEQTINQEQNINEEQEDEKPVSEILQVIEAVCIIILLPFNIVWHVAKWICNIEGWIDSIKECIGDIKKWLGNIMKQGAKYYKSKVNDAEKDIMKKWKEKWENDWQSDRPKISDDSFVGREEMNCFMNWLLRTMDLQNYTIEQEKKKNFFLKGAAILLFMVAYATYIGLTLIKDDFKWLWITPLIVGVPAFLLMKWIDIKKYQETWSRRTGYYSKVMQEMTKYLYEIGCYDGWQQRQERDIRREFINNILAITGSNVEKFQHNMENKENKLISGKYPTPK